MYELPVAVEKDIPKFRISADMKMALKIEKPIWFGLLWLVLTCWIALPLLAFAKGLLEKELVSPSTGMVFVPVPGGCYFMGDNEGYKYETPEHQVCVDSFYLGRFEVTQQQWMMLMQENRSRFMGEDHPVQRISWNDAMEFIRRLNQKEKTDVYRLPTEAEWERAARGGTDTRYFWGDEIDNEFAWYYGSALFTTHPVGTRRPNAFGLFDMLGNVWEWVSDWYDPAYYRRSPRDNPKGPSTGTQKTRRGGSMANLASYVRSASRYRDKPDKRHYILGFRVARSAGN